MDNKINISLNQGINFVKNQKKIKKEENKIIENYENINNNIIKTHKNQENIINNLNKKDNNEFKNLQNQFNILVKEYNETLKQLNNSSINNIDRLDGSKNPYLNKIIGFTTGHLCYVTNQGIVRWIPSSKVYDSLKINKSIVKVNLPFLNSYFIPGTIIPTNPPLISGKNVDYKESLGYEGTNVYVNSLNNNPSSKYIGCYIDNWNRAISGYYIRTNLEECQRFALENNYKYFGLQDYNNTNGLAQCFYTNDLNKAKSYGEGSKIINLKVIWETKTNKTDANILVIENTGNLVLKNSNSNKILWKSNNNPSDCYLGGYVNPDSVVGSYGGNCIGKPLYIDCGNPSKTESYKSSGIIGNLNDDLKDRIIKANKQKEKNFVHCSTCNYKGGDPAFCCAKLVDFSYQCGNGPFKTGSVSSGASINFNCSKEVDNCTFFCILQDDGNLVLYRGTEPNNNKGAIWDTKTFGKQKDADNNYIAIKGKFGRNYFKMGESLNLGDWIGSNDGKLILKLEKDGNLVLYTNEIKDGCVKNNNNYYGGPWRNAIYEINELGKQTNMGKLGYINENSELLEYPSDFSKKSNDYEIYNNYDAMGNDIGGKNTNNIEECKNECNKNNNCSGFVYYPVGKNCWLKNSNMYPKSQRQYNTNFILGVRKPFLEKSDKCSNKINNIDSITYENYKKGNKMSKNTNCNKSVVNENLLNKYNVLINKIQTLGNKIVQTMQNQSNIDNKLETNMFNNTNDNINSVDYYINTINKIKEEKYSFNITENMTNLNLYNNFNKEKLNIIGIDAMLKDSDLKLLKENYEYVFYSILALVSIIFTLKTFKQ